VKGAGLTSVSVMSIPEWLEGMLKDGRYRSKQAMADAFGLSGPAIVNYTKGRRNPDAPSCLKIARATGTPLEEVLEMAYGGGNGSSS